MDCHRKGSGILEKCREGTTAAGTTPPKPETVATIPSQADLFRRKGESLGVGTRKSDIRLDAIVRYVQRAANFDDLNAVWNALTEIGWSMMSGTELKLSVQTIPGKQIAGEYKEKLKAGQQSRK